MLRMTRERSTILKSIVGKVVGIEGADFEEKVKIMDALGVKVRLGAAEGDRTPEAR